MGTETRTENAASIHVPADPVEAVIQRVVRAYENEVAPQLAGRSADQHQAIRDRVGTWLASVSYDEWFALVDRLREVESTPEPHAASSLQCAAYTGKGGRCPNQGLREHDEVSEDGTGHGVWISWCDFHWRYYHPEARTNG